MSISPEPATEAEPAPRKCGFRFQMWNGLDHWHCDQCGISTFDRDAASSTKCKRDGFPALNPEN
jgi:hypothetical protein